MLDFEPCDFDLRDRDYEINLSLCTRPARRRGMTQFHLSDGARAVRDRDRAYNARRYRQVMTMLAASRRHATCAAVLAALTVTATPRARGPEPPPSDFQHPTFRTLTTLVEVDVVVKDGGAHVVRGLSQDDFEIFEDGRAQRIEAMYFVGVPGIRGSGPQSSALEQTVSVQVPPHILILAFDLEHMQPAAVLGRLAADTGGLALSNENDFGRALGDIGEDASSYYVLGYRPTNRAWDGRFRAITVRVKRPGLTLRARKGYLAAPATPTNTTTPAPATPPDAVNTGAVQLQPVHLPVEAAAVLATAAPLSTPDGSAVLAVVTGMTGPASLIDPTAIRLRPSDRPASADVTRLRDASSGAFPNARSLPAALLDQARDGWAAYQRGDTKSARSALSVPANHPDAPPWVDYVLGWSAFADGDYVTALDAWNVVRTVAPEFGPVYFDLADAYLRQRKRAEALEVLRNAEARWPNKVDVLDAVGVVQVSLGDLDGAVATFGRAVDAAPADESSQFNVACAKELRYVRSLRETTLRETDRSDAIAGYRGIAQLGGPMAEAARQGLHRLVPVDVRRVTCAPPTRVASLTHETLHGRPARLAWSPDGRQVYVWGVGSPSGPEGHVLVSVADGSVSRLTGAPDWVRAYWMWKGAQKAPWLPGR
jgi:tetratricopeptide (TPR) repeat protein